MTRKNLMKLQLFKDTLVQSCLLISLKLLCLYNLRAVVAVVIRSTVGFSHCAWDCGLGLELVQCDCGPN